MVEGIRREILPSDSIKIDGQEIMIPKQIIIINDRPDSVEIRQTAKGDLTYSLKVYGRAEEPEVFMKIVKDMKARVERMISVPEVDASA